MLNNVWSFAIKSTKLKKIDEFVVLNGFRCSFRISELNDKLLMYKKLFNRNRYYYQSAKT